MTEESDEIEYKKTNRECRLTPKRGLFWCWKCDRNIIGVGEKCSVCGAHPVKKTIKKETNA